MVGSVALLALVAHVIGISAIGDEVKTTSGTIKGHASEWQPEVSEYLGVPFARPPTGELRFTPPQPFTGTGVINAYKFVSPFPCLYLMCRVSDSSYFLPGRVSLVEK